MVDSDEDVAARLHLELRRELEGIEGQEGGDGLEESEREGDVNGVEPSARDGEGQWMYGAGLLEWAARRDREREEESRGRLG